MTDTTTTIKEIISTTDTVNNFTILIGLAYPILILVIFLFIIFYFNKQIKELLHKLSIIKVGSFEIQIKEKLRSAKIDSVYNLTSHELKFFLAIASQSWKVKSINWGLSESDNIDLHKKLELNGLYKIIKTNGGNVDGTMTKEGIELYDVIIEVIHNNINGKLC